MTRGDRIIVLLVVLAVLASVPLVSFASSVSSDAVVVRSPVGNSLLSLGRDGRYVVEGSRGRVVVKVAGGRASVVEADCPDHVCVKSGAVASGRPVVCVPNGVSVSLAAAPSGGLDAVSR
jgi:hypothetical protein